MPDSDQSNPSVTVSKRSNRVAVLASIIFILLLVAAVFLAIRKFIPKFNLSTSQKSPLVSENKSCVKGSSLFASQGASINNAQITKIDNSTITITKGGQTDTFKLSSDLLVIKQSSNSKPASPSSNLNDIELNRAATILLNVVAGEYQVVSIAYSANK